MEQAPEYIKLKSDYKALKAELANKEMEIRTLRASIEILSNRTLALITPKEASEILHVGLNTVHNLMRKGYLKSILVGRGERTTAKFITEFCDNYAGYDLSDIDKPTAREY